MERTAIQIPEVKLLVHADANSETDMTFSGYGAVFGNIDAHGDVIVPGAFKASLEDIQKNNRWPPMLLQHGGLTTEDETPIGVWIKLEEDQTGLRVEGKLAPTVRGKEIYQLLKMTPRPAISGMSIGYIAKTFTPRVKPEDPRRVLKEIALMEISVVTFPANSRAQIAQVKAAMMTIREIQRLLQRDAGFSRAEDKALVAGGFSALSSMRDAGTDDGTFESLSETLRKNVNFLRGIQNASTR